MGCRTLVVTNQKDLLTKIPCDTLCNDALESPLLKSLWENILQGCNQDLSKQTTKLCLENIIKLYLQVRSFSYAKRQQRALPKILNDKLIY